MREKNFGNQKRHTGRQEFTDRKRHTDRRDRDGRSYGSGRAYAEGKSYGEKKAYTGGRSYADGKPYGEKRTYTGERSYADGKPYGEKKPYAGGRSFTDGKPYREKRAYTGDRSFADGKPYREKKSYAGGRNYADEKPRTYERDFADRREPGREAPEPREFMLEGRKAVMEAFRAGRQVDRLYLLEDAQDGSIGAIKREAAKQGCLVKYVTRDRLDQMAETGAHQGVIASMAACRYAEVEEILARARQKGEQPFVLLLDGIQDPHNLGAILRTANLAGAHGVIIPKNRAVGLTATVAKASAGALLYTLVAKVTNLGQTIEELKKEGLWFVCADMDGDSMYELDLKGPIGLVIGAEGSGVSRLIQEKCDMCARIPMRGEIASLNASVAAGILSYEIVRQRMP